MEKWGYMKKYKTDEQKKNSVLNSPQPNTLFCERQWDALQTNNQMGTNTIT